MEIILYVILGIIVGGATVGFLINHYTRKRISEYKAENERLELELNEKEICESEIQELRIELENLAGRKTDLESEN